MAALDYNSIYTLQDKVLENIFSMETSFYLTGGTCLNRFYYNRRYSDDLDLFTNDNALFRDDVRIVIDSLKFSSIAYTVLVDTRDFVRLNIDRSLQVDLVNDRVFRHGKSILSSSGVVIDNIINICANKLCAIVGRDDPKDMFDLFTIFKEEIVEWETAIATSIKKCLIDPEVLQYRFETFPLELLELLKVVQPETVIEMKIKYADMVKHILASIP